MKRGSSRAVFLVGAAAFKVPRLTRFLAGLWCNRKERRLWAMVKDPFLCPVLAGDPFGLILVMPRAEEVPLAEFRTESMARVSRANAFRGRTGIEVEDLKPANMGTVDGREVMIDYAGLTPCQQAKLDLPENQVRP